MAEHLVAFNTEETCSVCLLPGLALSSHSFEKIKKKKKKKKKFEDESCREP